MLNAQVMLVGKSVHFTIQSLHSDLYVIVETSKKFSFLLKQEKTNKNDDIEKFFDYE